MNMSDSQVDQPTSFSLLVKPASADCNLRCSYCFYLSKAELYPGSARHRMSLETLERLISSYMATEQPQYVFGWQGGEPTLMGVEFFRKVVELQSRYGRRGAVVANGLQTNATRITDELAAVFARYRFLVGVSIDGPAELHDASRKAPGGGGSFERVMEGVALLQRHRVTFNALVAVSKANVERVEEVYRLLVERGIVHHQYIPIVEFADDGTPLPFSVGPDEWGRFLLRLYDLWYPDRYTVSVRHFDAVLARLVDGTETICTMSRDCRSYFLVEHNGDVYPCDFFVEPSWRLGNIHQSGWRELAGSDLYREFGLRKRQLHPECPECPYLELCAGDCIKHRVPLSAKVPAPGGAAMPGAEKGSGSAAAAVEATADPRALSRLCSGWKAFYGQALPGFRRLAREIQRQRSRALEERMRQDYGRELRTRSSEIR
jgi:uncharacterized protein